MVGTIVGQIYNALPWVQKLQYLNYSSNAAIGKSVLEFFQR